MSPRSDRPRRRSFTAQYKFDILTEYDAADPAARGVLLRREGLYSSHLSEWRKARHSGALGNLAPEARAGQEVRRAGREHQTPGPGRAGRPRACKTRAALEIVGKAQALLEMLSESADTEPRSKP